MHNNLRKHCIVSKWLVQFNPWSIYMFTSWRSWFVHSSLRHHLSNLQCQPPTWYNKKTPCPPFYKWPTFLSWMNLDNGSILFVEWMIPCYFLLHHVIHSMSKVDSLCNPPICLLIFCNAWPLDPPILSITCSCLRCHNCLICSIVQLSCLNYFQGIAYLSCVALHIEHLFIQFAVYIQLLKHSF